MRKIKGLGPRTFTVPGKGPDPTYYNRLPRTLPPGQVIVHNHIKPPIRSNGFRTWTQTHTGDLIRCHCGWSSRVHYR